MVDQKRRILRARVLQASRAPPDSGGPVLTGVAGPTDQATNAFAQPAGDVALGRDVFRFETFGNEGFWTRVLQLPQGMKAADVTSLMALALGISGDTDIGVAKGGQNGYPFVGRTSRMVGGAEVATGVQIGLTAGAKE